MSTVKRTDFTQTVTHVLATVYVNGAKDAARGQDGKDGGLQLTFVNRLGEAETVAVAPASEAEWDSIADSDAYKITVRLRKNVPGQLWASLNGPAKIPSAIATPYASGKTVSDWDTKTKDEDAADDEDVFAKLFKNADADAQRAMKKSMFESGGTTLSDSWADVGSRDMGKPQEESKRRR